MNRFFSSRTVSCLACAATVLGLFSACSGNDASTPAPPAGPVSIEITRITVAAGVVSPPAPSELGCDYRIGVVLQLGTGWNLQPPGFCLTTQCGQVRVSLLGRDGKTIVTRLAASAGVELNVAPLKAEAGSVAPVQNYSIRAELVDDTGKAFAEDAGSVAVEQAFQMSLPSGCAEPSTNSAGAGGGS